MAEAWAAGPARGGRVAGTGAAGRCGEPGRGGQRARASARVFACGCGCVRSRDPVAGEPALPEQAHPP